MYLFFFHFVVCLLIFFFFFFFFFNDTATTEIYTLSLHDALPILRGESPGLRGPAQGDAHGYLDPHRRQGDFRGEISDRKSTRLNSSHSSISYAVFCLKKKKKKKKKKTKTKKRKKKEKQKKYNKTL